MLNWNLNVVLVVVFTGVKDKRVVTDVIWEETETIQSKPYIPTSITKSSIHNERNFPVVDFLWHFYTIIAVREVPWKWNCDSIPPLPLAGGPSLIAVFIQVLIPHFGRPPCNSGYIIDLHYSAVRVHAGKVYFTLADIVVCKYVPSLYCEGCPLRALDTQASVAFLIP